MGRNSGIQWTNHTFNPWRGCTKVSPGCANCYAEAMSKRNPGVLGRWGPAGTRVIASESMWRAPLKWHREATAVGRRRVFCASLADVFEDRPELIEPRARLFRLIRETSNLDWLLLTKRPENIATLWPAGRGMPGPGAIEWPNVWLGTSVEDQRRAEECIPYLLQTPSAVRFLSVEPLIKRVDLTPWLHGEAFGSTASRREGPGGQLVTAERSPVDWVIVGGESGPKARPFNLAWARSIRDQCAAAGVACFIKQLGSYPFDSNGADGFPGAHRVYSSDEEASTPGALAALAITLELMMVDLADSHGGDWDEWPEDLHVRQFPGGLRVAS